MTGENYFNFSLDDWIAFEAILRDYMRNYTEQGEQQQGEYVENVRFEDWALSFEWRTTLICAFSIIIALSIVGNIGVIMVLLLGRSKTVLNRFLINLAVSDLMMAIFSMPFGFPTIMYGHWIFSAGMCPTMIFLQHVSIFVTVYTLAVIGIDRYMAIMWPLKARVTKNRVKLLIASIWLASVPWASVPTAFTKAKPFIYGEDVIYICAEWWPSTAAKTAVDISMPLISYCLPLSALFFAYFRIGRKLWGRKLHSNQDRQMDKMYSNDKKKIIKMLIVVVIMFTVCWLPLRVFNVTVTFSPHIFGDENGQYTLRKVNACVLLLAMSNSFMNPIIYTFFNDRFRNDIKDTVTRCGLCRAPDKSPCIFWRFKKSLISLSTPSSNGTDILTNTRPSITEAK
ncbi:RYamide receptor-like [Ptychodera flava]|uniref:RYamide receptor-like n=1 Tax=Ptychodera flava TaxID=63121 RepID=UPI003969D866